MHFLLFSFVPQLLFSPFLHHVLGKFPVLKQNRLIMQAQDVITHLFNLTLAVCGMRAQIMTPSHCGLGQSPRYYGGSDLLSCSRGATISCISDHNRTVVGFLAVTEYYLAWIVNNDWWYVLNSTCGSELVRIIHLLQGRCCIFNICSGKRKKTPFPFTSGFHLRRDEADWRQLNHWESRESTSKISWFIHNFSPHECWYGDVSIWWDRNVEAGPGCLWCTAQRDPRVISSASECFCLLCSLVLFSEDGRCVIFSFCRQTWLSLTYITRDRNKGSRRSLGNAVWINTPRRCSFNWSLLEENVCFVWIKADLQYSCFVLEASR